MRKPSTTRSRPPMEKKNVKVVATWSRSNPTTPTAIAALPQSNEALTSKPSLGLGAGCHPRHLAPFFNSHPESIPLLHILYFTLYFITLRFTWYYVVWSILGTKWFAFVPCILGTIWFSVYLTWYHFVLCSITWYYLVLLCTLWHWHGICLHTICSIGMILAIPLHIAPKTVVLSNIMRYCAVENNTFLLSLNIA